MYSFKNSVSKGWRVWHHCGLRFAVLAMIVTAGAGQAIAQCVENQKLAAAEAGGGDLFGRAVSVSEDTALVGAPKHDCVVGVGCGAAYMFRFDGVSWVEEQKLIAVDEGSNGLYGTAVTVSGGTAIVADPSEDCAAGRNCGAAYVFRFNGTSWIEEQKLTASDAASSAEFGLSVMVSGETAVIGASGDGCAAGGACGAAYVFRFNGASWVEEQKLTASDSGAVDQFGESVSLSGQTVVIGALGDDCVAGDNCGAAYVFRFDGISWVEKQKLTASDAAAGDVFGASVSVNGNAIVVGAWRAGCAMGDWCGAAYVFRFDGVSWLEEQELTASDAAARDVFGFSVSLSGETAVVGAMGFGNGCPADVSCGSAYVFRFNGTSWIEVQKLAASDVGVVDQFGFSVSVSGETGVVGAYLDDCAAGRDCGAAYVFSCASPPPLVHLDIKPSGCPNPVNPKPRGVLPVAVVGSDTFDVNDIDVSSVLLGRADGVGMEITPANKKNGRRHASIEDVATPFETTGCDCHELGGDGIDDLSLKFSTSEMNRAFGLKALHRGETIELVLRGALQDGTAFTATDCIVVPGTDRDSRTLRRHGGRK